LHYYHLKMMNNFVRELRVPKTLQRTFVFYFAQLLNLFLGWVVAKLNVTHLTVAEYGQLSFFITVINIAYVFFTIGIFESASRQIAITESLGRYRQILAATIFFSLISYLVFTTLFGLSHPILDSVFEVKIGNLVKILFPLAGVYLFSNMWQLVLRGAGKIHRLSVFMVGPRVVYVLALILLILFRQFSLFSTALFNLISIAVFVTLFAFTEKPDFSALFESVRKLWEEVRTFGVHLYWSELIKVFLYHTDKLLISFFIDAENLAYYALAYTITFPLSFFSTALSVTYYKKFSVSPKLDRRIILLNILWISVSVIIFIVLRRWIILTLFSEKYLTSLTVFPILAIAFGFAGLSKLFSFYLTARGAGREIRNISVSILIVHLSLNFIFIPIWGIIGAAVASLLTYIIDFLLSVYYYQRFQKARTSLQ